MLLHSLFPREVKLLHSNALYCYYALLFSLIILLKTDIVCANCKAFCTLLCYLIFSQMHANSIIKNDYVNGIFEQFILRSRSMQNIVTCKIVSHWIIISLPCVAVYLIFSEQNILASNLSFTFIISAYGILTAALTCNAKNNNAMNIIISAIFISPIILIYCSLDNANNIHLYGSTSLLTVMLISIISSIYASSYALKSAISEIN